MTNEQLSEIIKIQSQIIDKLCEEFIKEEHYLPQKEAMRKLQKELQEKIKAM